MRYLLVLLVFFASHAVIFSPPVQARKLEIRSMLTERSKLTSRMAHKLARFVFHDKIGGLVFPPALIAELGALGAGPYLLPLPGWIDPVWIAIGALATIGPLTMVTLDGAWSSYERALDRFARGETIHYVKRHKGKRTLCLGCIQERPRRSDETVLVKTFDQNYVQVPLNDISGFSIPNHSDMHRRVSLFAGIDHVYDLYHIGRVSKVYDDGNYAIEVDSKVDLDGVESSIHEPITIFVHSSLPKDEGGFVFIDSKASEDKDIEEEGAYVEDPFHHELITAARQTDLANNNDDRLWQRTLLEGE